MSGNGGGAHFGVYEAEERETDFLWSIKAEVREPIYFWGAHIFGGFKLRPRGGKPINF